jgi:hypothetical protein
MSPSSQRQSLRNGPVGRQGALVPQRAVLVGGVLLGLSRKQAKTLPSSPTTNPVAAVVAVAHLEMQELLEAEEIQARQILVGLDPQQHQAQVQMW